MRRLKGLVRRYALLAEDRMGELLENAIPHNGGRPRENGTDPIPFPKRLKEIGVSKVESSNAQQIPRTRDGRDTS
jgi:hypothetical protein